MPDLKSPTPATESFATEWFLKTNNNSVFGPVDRATLQAWAQQGRIAPGNQVSTDKKKWENAKSVPFLEMQWVVQLPGGTEYGPLNINALKELVQDGTVPVSAIIKNIHSNETVRLEEKTGVSSNNKTAPKKEAQSTVPEAQHPSHGPEPEKKTVKKSRKTRIKPENSGINCDKKKKKTSQNEQRLKQEIKTTKQEFSKLRESFSRSKSEMEKKEKEYHSRIEQLESQLSNASKEAKEAYEKLEQLENKHNSLLEQKKESEQQLKDQIDKQWKQAEELKTGNLRYREELAQKEKQLRQGKEEYSRLQKQAVLQEQQLKAEIEQLREKLESTSRSCHKELDVKIDTLRKKVETASAALEDAMRRLAEKQREYDVLQARAEQEKRELSTRLEEFKQLLAEESEKARQELEGDRSIFDIVRASCEQKTHNYNQRIERLEKLIGNDTEGQNTCFPGTDQRNGKQDSDCRTARNIIENPTLEQSASPGSPADSNGDNGKLTRLKSLETEIQQELEQWRENKRRKMPERKFPPKAIFRAKPWMKMK